MRNSLQPLLVLLGCTALAVYFTHSAIKGRYGLEAQEELIERSEELRREIKSLETVHADLHRHVNLLRSEPPDADFVEEIARRNLGYAYDREIIMYYR